MQCIGRIARVDGIRHFHNGKRRFYLEYRCRQQALPGTQCCARCTGRGRDTIQSSGKFDHGLVTEDVPDHSHMYGGKHYREGCNAFGTPSEEDIQSAVEHQRIARMGLVHEIVTEVVNEVVNEVVTEVVTEVPNEVVTEVANEVIIPKKRKPRIVRPANSPKKERKPRTKPESVKEVASIPSVAATYIERDPEEVYIDDYEIEHIQLYPFEHNHVHYFKDPVKNKLFDRIHGALGAYIGRYDPYTETIRTDIPDSDDES